VLGISLSGTPFFLSPDKNKKDNIIGVTRFNNEAGDNGMEELVLNFIEKTLKDDQGISEEAYDALCEIADEINDQKLTNLLMQVDATDGRFYIGE
jgi:hypothetical protein